MPRQRRAAPARSGTSRPTITPSRQPAPPQQPPRREASTSAHPPATSSQGKVPAAQAGNSPGLFGQMASTAAYETHSLSGSLISGFTSMLSYADGTSPCSGVAVGSSIGHAIGGFFGGDSSNAARESQVAENVGPSQVNNAGDRANQWGASSCDTAAKQFTTCMNENGGDMQICNWYLDQLVRCS